MTCTDNRPNGDSFGPEITRNTKPTSMSAPRNTATPPAPSIPVTAATFAASAAAPSMKTRAAVQRAAMPLTGSGKVSRSRTVECMGHF